MKRKKPNKKETLPCIVCGENTFVGEGWHLKGNLNFCSNKCVAGFIEKTMALMILDLNKQEKRIHKLETALQKWSKKNIN